MIFTNFLFKYFLLLLFIQMYRLDSEAFYLMKATEMLFQSNQIHMSFQCHMVSGILYMCDVMLMYTNMYFRWCQAKLAAIKDKFGREIRVFETSAASPSSHVVSNSGMQQHFNFCAFYLTPRYALSLKSSLSGLLSFGTPMNYSFCIPYNGLFYFDQYYFLCCMAEETDDFYEFTAEDYYRISASKKEGKCWECSYFKRWDGSFIEKAKCDCKS